MHGHAGLISLPIALPMAALAAGLLASGAEPARAGQAAFCVTCKGPDQTYLCRVTGEDLHRNDGLKLYCVVRTAKEGGHASCAARDEIAGCNGVEKTYAYNGPDIADGLALDPRVKKLMERVDGAEKSYEKHEKRKSLVEVTGEAMSASRRGLRNVRTSLGGGRDTSQPSSVARGASGESLPDLPANGAAPLPSGTASMPSTHEATLSPDILTAPPEHQSRVRRGALKVGHFARSSYRCVWSLFRKCRGEPEVLPAPN